jgi:hypothetical protein
MPVGGQPRPRFELALQTESAVSMRAPLVTVHTTALSTAHQQNHDVIPEGCHGRVHIHVWPAGATTDRVQINQHAAEQVAWPGSIQAVIVLAQVEGTASNLHTCEHTSTVLTQREGEEGWR